MPACSIIISAEIVYRIGLVVTAGNDSNLLIVFYVQIMP
ncbi:DUF2170 domain-containing protein, partial [Shigella sonnei]